MCSGAGEEFCIGHGGVNEGFLAQLTLWPALGRGVAVMINSIQGWPLLDEILKAIAREYDFPSSQRAPEAKSMPQGSDYSGLYTNQDGVAFEVIQSSEGLSLKFEQQPPIPLAPASDGEFFTTVLDLRVRFQKKGAQLSASMAIVSGGTTINITRKIESVQE